MKILRINDRGNLEKERLVLKADAIEDLGHYLIFKTTLLDEGGFSARPDSRVFWLPDRQIKKGDMVVIYSKEGSLSTKENKDKSTSLFFYWNSKVPLWSKDTDTVVLIKVSEYQAWAAKIEESKEKS